MVFINPNSKDFQFNPGEVIRHFRDKLTLREAAHRLNLNHSFLNKIESGERKPSLEKLLMIGKEYKIPFNILKRLAEFYKLDISSIKFINSDKVLEVKTLKSRNTIGKGVSITWTMIRTSK